MGSDAPRAQLSPTPLLPVVVVIAVVVGIVVVDTVTTDLQPENLCEETFGEEWDAVDPDVKPGDAMCQHPNGTVRDPWQHIENTTTTGYA